MDVIKSIIIIPIEIIICNLILSFLLNYFGIILLIENPIMNVNILAKNVTNSDYFYGKKVNSIKISSYLIISKLKSEFKIRLLLITI